MSAGPADAITGDWDGTRAREGADAEHQLAELQRQLRAAFLDIVEHRDRWSQDPTAEGRVRAVAYQTCASRLLRIINTQRRHTMPTTEPDDHVAPRRLCDPGPHDAGERKPLGWLFRGQDQP